MRQKKTHLQLSFRSKSRVRTSFRRNNGFVSYSGVGSPKSKIKRTANTPRIPYNYTNEQKWNTFFTNGRPRFHKCCLLLCDVIFESGSCSFWEESHSHLPGRHAEVKALKHISMKEQETDTNARFVAFYLSYSPCANCANFILDFSRSRPQCQLSLGFSCLFRHEEELHRDGLRRLNAAAPRIFLGVFTDLEWKRLADATGISFRYNSPRRHAWDLKWKAEFENILKEEVGKATFCPSVLSQEGDLDFIVQPATQVPQDQGLSSRDAATSSNWSNGFVSEMQWQNCDVERQEPKTLQLLDAVEMEIAETRNTTLQPSVPSEKREESSVVIPTTHFPQEQGWTSGGSARSSGLPQGHDSRTSLVKCDEQPERGLIAVALEIPEGNGAVVRCVKNRCMCYGVVCGAITLVVATILLSVLM